MRLRCPAKYCSRVSLSLCRVGASTPSSEPATGLAGEGLDLESGRMSAWMGIRGTVMAELDACQDGCGTWFFLRSFSQALFCSTPSPAPLLVEQDGLRLMHLHVSLPSEELPREQDASVKHSDPARGRCFGAGDGPEEHVWIRGHQNTSGARHLVALRRGEPSGCTVESQACSWGFGEPRCTWWPVLMRGERPRG